MRWPLLPGRSVFDCVLLFLFFFQAEDGIRDRNVTGVQTCALPILYFMIANLLSLYLMTRLLHSEGRSIWDVIDFQRDRLGKDLLWGLLWIFALFIPLDRKSVV